LFVLWGKLSQEDYDKEKITMFNKREQEDKLEKEMSANSFGTPAGSGSPKNRNVKGARNAQEATDNKLLGKVGKSTISFLEAKKLCETINLNGVEHALAIANNLNPPSDVEDVAEGDIRRQTSKEFAQAMGSAMIAEEMVKIMTSR
jgi:hypothetical protein